MSNPSDSRDIIDLFINNKINLSTLYDTLLAPEVQLPSYYTDIIQQRRISMGNSVPDDCSKFVLKYEAALFTQNK